MGGSLHLSAPWTPGGLASGIWAPLGVSAGGGARSGVGARARVGEGEMPWLATSLQREVVSESPPVGCGF